GLALAGKDHALSMPRRQQSCQYSGEGCRADNGEIEWRLGHAPLLACGNASDSRMRVSVVFRRIGSIDGAFLPRAGVKRPGPMLFWFIATAITAIACVALFYAAGRRAVNAGPAELDDANSHFRLVLAGIDADVASGKLGDADAAAAKGELAREILRLKAETGQASIGSLNLSNAALLAGLGGIAIIALGLYGWLGSPDLP